MKCPKGHNKGYCILTQGVLFSDYVIEVRILPWDPEKDYKGGLGKFIKLQPIHADEEGKVYFRRQASLVQVDISISLNDHLFFNHLLDLNVLIN